jgi:hypothetical protein
VRFPELVIDILAVNVPQYIFAGIEQLLGAEDLSTHRLPPSGCTHEARK